MNPFPPIPPGGLTETQLRAFVDAAGRDYWQGVASNGLEPLLDFHLRQSFRRPFDAIWDAFNAEDAIPNPENGSLAGFSDEVLSWLDFQDFAPKILISRDDPIEKTIEQIKKQAFYATKAHFILSISRGIVADFTNGEPAGHSLIYTPYLQDYESLKSLSAAELEAEYAKQCGTSFEFPFTYSIKDRAGKSRSNKASIGIRFELRRDLDLKQYHLRTHSSIEFQPPPPWEINPLAFWNAAAEAIEKQRPENISLPLLDWGAYLTAAMLSEPAEPTDPNQLELPLEAQEKPITLALDLATFPFPSDNNGRLLHLAFAVAPPKDWRRLSKISAIPKAERTPREIQDAEDIKGRIVMKRKPEFDNNYMPMAVTLGLKIRDSKLMIANAETTIFPENLAGGDVTPEHLEDAEDRFFQHFDQLFTGQGRRHFALLIKELAQSGWRSYQFEAGAHVAKMRNIKPGESPTRAEKEEAKRTVAYLCNSLFDIQSREGKRITADRQKYFTLERVQETNDRKGEVWTISATDQLKNLFRNEVGNALRYVPVLESIIREDHQAHGIAAMLNIHLSQLWRMDKKDPVQRLSIKKIFDLIGKDPSPANDHRMRDLKQLEKELDYMAAQNPPYLGAWEGDGDAPRPSKCKASDPFECSLILSAPDWLRPALKQIQERRGAYLPKPAEQGQAMTREALESIIHASGLSANKFADAAGVSRGFLSKVRAGTKEITPAVAGKILARFGALTIPPAGVS